MREAVIVEAVRSARGKRKGSLSGVHPMDLLAHSLRGLVERTHIDPLEVDDPNCLTALINHWPRLSACARTVSPNGTVRDFRATAGGDVPVASKQPPWRAAARSAPSSRARPRV